MGSRIKWTEEKISQMQSDGFGTGAGENYKPWLSVSNVSSAGVSRRIFGQTTNRTHHLLSDVEFNLFSALEWQRDVIDIREQYPLDRAATRSVAQKIGIKHPYYPGTHVATVMTVDFLVTKRVGNKEVLIAFNAKRADDIEDERALAKLEIQRATLSMVDVAHHVFSHTDLDNAVVRSIAWMRDGVLSPKEHTSGFDWSGASGKFLKMVSNYPGLRLYEFCQLFDNEQCFEQGTGLRLAKLLLWQRDIGVKLSLYPLAEVPIAEFNIARMPGQFLKVRRA